MPTYEWLCESCGKKEEAFSLTMSPTPPTCCETNMKKAFPSSITICFRGDSWPSKVFAREREDNYIRSATRRARELKDTGKVRQEDVISFSDVEKLNPE